eukprot:937008_1
MMSLWLQNHDKNSNSLLMKQMQIQRRDPNATNGGDHKKRFKLDRIVLNKRNPLSSQIFELPSKQKWIQNEKQWLAKQKRVRAWNDDKKCVDKSFTLEDELPHIISSKTTNDTINKQTYRLRKAQDKANKENQKTNKKRKRSTEKSSQPGNKKRKIDDASFVISDTFVEYDDDGDADDEDEEE